jgi:DNA invertase Pin-like site-specific DNA recombinase
MLAIYTRLSREDEESNSIKNQLREGKAFAKLHNLKYKLYNEDEGISGGADIEDRPELKELIKDIIDVKITTVWFRNQDRLERSSLTYSLFIGYCKKYNVKIYYADKLFDLTNSKEVFFGNLISAFNQLTIELQSEKTIKSLQDNADEGKYQGILAYGYTKDLKKVWVVDEEEAKIVKRIFQMSLDGVGTNKIAEILTQENIPTRYNKIGKGNLKTKNKYTKEITTTKKSDIIWSGNTIRNIITNTIYKGIKTYKDKTYPIEAIITPEHWDEVNDNLSKNRNNSGKVVEHRYLLKGLIRCGKCGRNYYGRSREDKSDHYYMCSSKRNRIENCGNRSINIDFIEKLIWDDLFEQEKLKNKIINYFDNTDEKAKIEEFIEENKNKNNIKQQSLKEKDNATKYLLKGILSEEDATKQLNRINKELKQIDILIKHNLNQIEFYQNKTHSVQELTKDLNNFKDKTPFNQKQELVNQHIKNIKIYSNVDKREFLITIEFNTFGSLVDYKVDWLYKETKTETKYMFDWLKEEGIDIFNDAI